MPKTTLEAILANPDLTEKEKYQKYIKNTDEWAQKRNIVLKRDNYTCRTCGRTADEATLTVHHRSYSFLFHEEDNNYEDLITLCKFCHHGIHKVPNNWKRFKIDSPE